MIKNSVEFKFKGSRTYVHGTDIYNSLLKMIDFNCSKIDLTFHGITHKNLMFTSQLPENNNIIKVAFKYQDNQNKISVIYGLENEVLIKDRYEYDENSIYVSSILDLNNQEIVLTKETSYSFIENIVAMNKYLLENLFDVNGKWYFTRLQLNESIIRTDRNLKVKFKSNFNFKLTKSEIFVDDKLVGYIYFSLV